MTKITNIDKFMNPNSIAHSYIFELNEELRDRLNPPCATSFSYIPSVQKITNEKSLMAYENVRKLMLEIAIRNASLLKSVRDKSSIAVKNLSINPSLQSVISMMDSLPDLSYFEFTNKQSALLNLSYYESINRQPSQATLKSLGKKLFSELKNDLEVNDAFNSEEKEQIVNDLSKPRKFKKYLNRFWNFFQILCVVATVTGVDLDKLIEYVQSADKYKNKLEMLCGKIPELSKLPAEVREVYLTSGSLSLRKYDNKKSEVLHRLDNGERFCVLYPPKGNSRWLKVAVKTPDGKTVTGYVMRKYTKKVYYDS